MPRLVVKLPGGTKTVPIGDEAVTIGRTNDNTLPLDDVGVSRRHAQILFVGKGYEVVDMGSRNGTKVNGQKVPRALLKPGDVIGIGGVDMVFDQESMGPVGGLELEELDLGGASSSAPAPAAAKPTSVFQAEPGGVPSAECVLRFVAGEKEGTDVPLKATRSTFGRRPNNTVSFQDSAVSGLHCEITREANGYVLRDLGSTNGTLVDGEPVVETMLRHNSRIRIGAQRAIFVDPTVADIESTLATDDSAEWGLMKGEIDLSAARAAGGRGGLLVAVAVLALAGGGAWFAVQAAPRIAIVEPVKDNRIAEASFEDGVVRWFAAEEGGARARVVGGPEAPRGASGHLSLEVLPQGEGPGVVEFSTAAAGGGDATVSAESAYEISARVGSGRGAVVVTWVSGPRPGLLREDSSPPVDGAPAWTETKAVVVAPAHATGARIGLAAFGGAPATFDDVVFRRVDAGKPPAFSAGDLTVRIDASGCVEAVRGGGDILLTEGGLAPAADTPSSDLLGSAVASGPAMDGAALAAKAALPGGTAFTIRVEPAEGGASISCAPEGGPGAFTFTCPAGAARSAVTLVLDKTALVLPEQESFAQEGVRKLIVGTADGPRPFVLSADPASPGFSLSSRRTPRGLRLQLGPAGAAVFLSVDLSREAGAAEGMLRDAETMERERKKGAALSAYESVSLQYHYLPKYRDPAVEGLTRLHEEARARLKEAKRLAAEGKEFKSVPDLSAALQAADSLGREFEGSPAGTEAGALAEGAKADLKTVRAASLDERVEKLFQRAVDYEANRQPMLALLLYEEIERVAPEDDERRGRAVERTRALREETQRGLETTYGAAK